MAHRRNQRNQCNYHNAYPPPHERSFSPPSLLCDLQAQLLESLLKNSNRSRGSCSSGSTQGCRSNQRYYNKRRLYKVQPSVAGLSEYLRMQVPGIFTSFDYLTESLKDVSAKLQLMLDILLNQQNPIDDQSKVGQSTTMTNKSEQCQPLAPNQQKD